MPTTDEFITTVRTRARIPDGASAFSDSEILSLADQETSLVIVPMVRRAHGEWWVWYADQSLVADQSGYRIPDRAQHGKVRDVTLRDANSNEWSIPEIPLEERGRYASGASPWWPAGAAYCLQRNHVVIVPTPGTAAAGSTVRIRYYQKPNSYVLAAACDQITVVSSEPAYTVTDTPPNAAAAGTATDIIRDQPGHDWLAIDESPSDVTSNVVTYSSVPFGAGAVQGGEVSVGDWICLAGQTCVFQMPEECVSLLIALVAGRVLESLGDGEGYQRAQDQVGRYSELMQPMLKPRNDGESRPLINWQSPLRGGRRWR